MKHVLLIAYHFPPIAGSSGVQRALRFAQYLPEYGWQPVVLTVNPMAYERASDETLADIPPHCEVHRSLCFDAARQLALFGRYPERFASPDRWASWFPFGVLDALRICRRQKIDAVWSTFPIATAHRIAAAVSRRTGIPWVADFRDPMAADELDEGSLRRRAVEDIERTVMTRADRVVFVTESGRRDAIRRFPALRPERTELLENGFDEGVFSGVSRSAIERSGPLVLLHSGIVYPAERDPEPLFQALARIALAGDFAPTDLKIRFRAPVHVDLLRELAGKYRVGDWIEICDPVPYRAALQEMLDVDGLIVMQGRICNGQIPAKAYEYLRAGTPVLALADPVGDTGAFLSGCGVEHVVALEDTDAVAQALRSFCVALRSGGIRAAAPERVGRYSRRTLTGRLASVLDSVAKARGPGGPDGDRVDRG